MYEQQNILPRVSVFFLRKIIIVTFSLQQVTITTRQLLCHKSGIRHYELKNANKVKKKGVVKAKDNEKEEDKCHGGKKDSGKAADNITVPSEKGNKGKGENKDASEDVSKSSKLKTGKIEQGEKMGSETSADRNVGIDAEARRKEIDDVLVNQMNKNLKKKKEEKEKDEFDMLEYYIKEEFDTVKEAMELFQKDELFFKPGKCKTMVRCIL